MPKQGEHNKWIALALCILLGYLGLHRFYEGKIATGNSLALHWWIIWNRYRY